MIQRVDLLLGVDGGGSKTVAWLAESTSENGFEILGRGLAGPANVASEGTLRSLDNLDRAIAAAFTDAAFPRQSVDGCCFGLAGADGDRERDSVRDWASQQGVARNVRVENDGMLVLSAASPICTGVALISGTGSFAFARNSIGETARCGGWGYLFGDEGSGFQIAVNGLRAASRGIDGRGPETMLVDLCLQHFEIARSPNQLKATIYSRPFDRKKIAALAPSVFQASAQGDFVASQILQQAATALAAHVQIVANKIGLAQKPIQLAVSGGVLINSAEMRDRLSGELREAKLETNITIVADSVLGALRIAATLP